MRIFGLMKDTSVQPIEGSIEDTQGRPLIKAVPGSDTNLEHQQEAEKLRKQQETNLEKASCRERLWG